MLLVGVISSRIKQVESCSSAFELVAVGGTWLLPASHFECFRLLVVNPVMWIQPGLLIKTIPLACLQYLKHVVGCPFFRKNYSLINQHFHLLAILLFAVPPTIIAYPRSFNLDGDLRMTHLVASFHLTCFCVNAIESNYVQAQNLSKAYRLQTLFWTRNPPSRCRIRFVSKRNWETDESRGCREG